MCSPQMLRKFDEWRGVVGADWSACTRDDALRLLDRFPRALSLLPLAWRDDAGVVAGAVTADGCVLEHASPRLRDTEAVVLLAVRSHGQALRYASHRLRDDGAVVAAAVSDYGVALRHASDRLRADADAIVAASASCCHAVEYAGPAGLDARTAARAVEANRHAAWYLPPHLRPPARDGGGLSSTSSTANRGRARAPRGKGGGSKCPRKQRLPR